MRAPDAAARTAMILALFEHSGDMMHVVGPDRRLRLVNPAWCKTTGWSEAELIGRPMLELFHPDDAPGVGSRVARAKAGMIAESEVRIRLKDGSYRWFAGRRIMLPDGNNLVTLRDAEEAVARRAELEEARRTRKLLGAAAGLGVWGYDPVDDRVEWSDELVALTGVTLEDACTHGHFAKVLHPREQPKVSGRMRASTVTGDPCQMEHRLRRGDRWLTVRTTYHTEARPGGLYALKGISEDITELVEAREAARKREQQARRARKQAQANASRLKLALAGAHAGVYEIDHVGKKFWASPEFERLTGRGGATYEEATQLRFPGFHPDDLDHVRASFRALHMGSKKSGEAFEARIVRPNGETRWVRVSHHLKVGRGGRWLKAVGMVEDFDARKRQELALVDAQRAAEAAAEAKAAFLANMSHEIRTPMNGVMGVLHLLKSEPLSPDGRRMLEEALSCGQMLAELLNDVIDFSKIEAGRLELACEPVDACSLIEGVARLLRPQAETKGLELTTCCDDGVGWVRSDPVRLRQALFNLVGNAVKFTEHGRVAIRCRVPSCGRLRFEVEDTGVGIPLAAQPRIFQRFDQGDASTTRRFGGSGLGLSITQKLAEMMDGEVGFTSTEGQGSVFWLDVAADTAAQPAPPAETPALLLSGLRVLVVEDNATNRMIASKLLESLGASVETAADGYLGVEAAGHGGFDLILMDVQMPGIDGLEAARRIRALGGAAAATPIVALTANVLSHQQQRYLDAGMDGVVGKPISPASLVAEIARIGDRPAAPETGDEAVA